MKRAAKRVESQIVQQVRAACVERDGHCRLIWGTVLQKDEHRGPDLDYCSIKSEWAHLGDKKRFKTRGQEPAERHCTTGSLMLCDRHHRMYDIEHTLTITPLTERGADGPLKFERVTF